ncbi:MAG: DUF2062 domain-containing protein [Bryobacteraceae bacterium]
MRDILRQGLSPEKLALSLTLGVVLGVFPVVGATTLLCAAAALLLRLNLPAIQIANYLVYPLQFALLIPWIRLGERLFGVAPLPLSLDQIRALLDSGAWNAARALGASTLGAIAAWLLVAPLAAFPIYWLLASILRSSTLRRRLKLG